MRLTEEQYRDLMARRDRVPPGGIFLVTDQERRALNAMESKPKRPKYGNRKTTDAAGNVHDSGKEFRRYQELQLREIAGEIQNLRHHVPLACVVNGEHICDYEADFMYREGAAVIVEDVKPKDAKFRKTAAYRLFRVKQKLAQALHNLQIREV